MKRSFMVWPLVFFLFCLGEGGVYGGYEMLSDPTDNSLQFEKILPLLPIPNFILPGIFLLIVMDIFQYILIYGLLAHPNRNLINHLMLRSNYY